MRKLRKRRKSWGCTLVEVLAVTGAMSSLGGGAFTGATDKAKQTVCEQNLRQLGLAVQMFADDNDGKYPEAWFLPKDLIKDPRSIGKLLMPYVNNKSLFMCPSAPDAIQKFGLGYLWNDQLNNLTSEQITNPSQTWMMTDINAAATALTPAQAKQGKVDLSAIPPAHVGGYNILYADGHVKWSKEPPKIQPILQSPGPGKGQPQQPGQGGGEED
ncbi:MAG: prepilin-type N-terminal cleavage/methylation domain-containing protein [Armatimonadetes bacterium]|nr:prepilin-type N-terminal cleavage/methylation domain-containing protein [Armatimonadota bacterium]